LCSGSQGKFRGGLLTKHLSYEYPPAILRGNKPVANTATADRTGLDIVESVMSEDKRSVNFIVDVLMIAAVINTARYGEEPRQ
jgi:hypothetical protein